MMVKAHNCQNAKVDSSHVPVIKFYRVEAVGLSLFNYTFKILMSM